MAGVASITKLFEGIKVGEVERGAMSNGAGCGLQNREGRPVRYMPKVPPRQIRSKGGLSTLRPSMWRAYLDLVDSLHACTYARSQENPHVAFSSEMCLRLRLWRWFKYRTRVYLLVGSSHEIDICEYP
jgi:hypothetical protein